MHRSHECCFEKKIPKKECFLQTQAFLKIAKGSFSQSTTEIGEDESDVESIASHQSEDSEKAETSRKSMSDKSKKESKKESKKASKKDAKDSSSKVAWSNA